MYGKAVGAAKIAELKQKAKANLVTVSKQKQDLNEAAQAKLLRAEQLFANGRYAAAITLLDEITQANV